MLTHLFEYSSRGTHPFLFKPNDTMPYSIYRVYDKLETKFFPFLRNPLLLLVFITHASALLLLATIPPVTSIGTVRTSRAVFGTYTSKPCRFSRVICDACRAPKELIPKATWKFRCQPLSSLLSTCCFTGTTLSLHRGGSCCSTIALN